MTLRYFVSVLAVCTVALLHGSSQAVASEMTPGELKAAEAEFAKMKRDSKEYKQMVTAAQMALGAFGFGVGPFDGVLNDTTRKAIRAYQTTRQLTQTGDLDAKTFFALVGDLEVVHSKVAGLPGYFLGLSFWDDGFVTAKGTWVIVGERSGRPVQTSEISCYRERGICVEATAHLHNDFLSVAPAIYDLERWDEHEIVTKPSTGTSCVRYTTRIGRANKAVTGLRLRVRDTDLCKDMAPELHLKLVDGFEVMRELLEQRNVKLKGVLQAPGLADKP